MWDDAGLLGTATTRRPTPPAFALRMPTLDVPSPRQPSSTKIGSTPPPSSRPRTRHGPVGAHFRTDLSPEPSEQCPPAGTGPQKAESREVAHHADPGHRPRRRLRAGRGRPVGRPHQFDDCSSPHTRRQWRTLWHPRRACSAVVRLLAERDRRCTRPARSPSAPRTVNGSRPTPCSPRCRVRNPLDPAAERIALDLIQRMQRNRDADRAARRAGGRHRGPHCRHPQDDARPARPRTRRGASGGGHNHRFSLSDAVMAKDNHLAVLTASGLSVTDALLRRARSSPTPRTLRSRSTDSTRSRRCSRPASTRSCSTTSASTTCAGVALIAGRAIVEASGNVTLDTVRAIAATGVDVISSAPSPTACERSISASTCSPP